MCVCVYVYVVYIYGYIFVNVIVIGDVKFFDRYVKLSIKKGVINFFLFECEVGVIREGFKVLCKRWCLICDLKDCKFVVVGGYLKYREEYEIRILRYELEWLEFVVWDSNRDRDLFCR